MYLDSPRLADVARVLGAAVERLRAAGGKVILILDQPDVLLAAASPGDGVTGTAWKDVVLGLREVGFHFVVTFTPPSGANYMQNRKSTRPSLRRLPTSHWFLRRLQLWRRSMLPSSCPWRMRPRQSSA